MPPTTYAAPNQEHNAARSVPHLPAGHWPGSPTAKHEVLKLHVPMVDTGHLCALLWLVEIERFMDLRTARSPRKRKESSAWWIAQKDSVCLPQHPHDYFS